MAGEDILYTISCKTRREIDEELFTAITAIDHIRSIMHDTEVQSKVTVREQREVLSRLNQVFGRLESLYADLDYFEELEKPFEDLEEEKHV